MTNQITINRAVVEQALKLHEAQIVNENYDHDGCFQHWDDHITLETLVETYRAALAEQPAEQEPVAWMYFDSDGDAIFGHPNGYRPEDAVPVYTAPQPAKQPLTDERIESVRHMRDVQGYDGNWNCDPYMQGLYNGLEFALSLLEGRQPEFKAAPETWLGDIKVKRDKLSSEAHHGITGETK